MDLCKWSCLSINDGTLKNCCGKTNAILLLLGGEVEAKRLLPVHIIMEEGRERLGVKHNILRTTKNTLISIKFNT